MKSSMGSQIMMNLEMGSVASHLEPDGEADHPVAARAGILQWCADESMMFRRVTNELHCYPGRPKTPEPLRKVRVDDLGEYSVSPAGRTAAFFVPEKKGKPAVVKVVSLDALDVTVAQKTFFQ